MLVDLQKPGVTSWCLAGIHLSLRSICCCLLLLLLSWLLLLLMMMMMLMLMMLTLEFVGVGTTYFDLRDFAGPTKRE